MLVELRMLCVFKDLRNSKTSKSIHLIGDTSILLRMAARKKGINKGNTPNI